MASVKQSGSKSLADLIGKVARNDKNTKSINLRFYLITDNEFQVLCNALKTNNMVHTIDCSFKDLGDKKIFQLAQMLQENKSIESLDISGSVIQTIEPIIALLEDGNNLKELKIRSCAIVDMWAEQIAEKLQTNVKLEKLDISSNYLGNEGAEHFSFTLV